VFGVHCRAGDGGLTAIDDDAAGLLNTTHLL
jgi:hypothetical protein